MIRSKIKLLSCPQHFLRCKSMGKIFNAQGHVTEVNSPLWPEMELLQDLCMSSLSASLKKIRSKLKALWCPQLFFHCSRAGNSVVNGQMWPEFEFVWDSPGYLQVWWWYDKKWGHFCVYNIFSIINMGKNFGAQGRVTPKRVVRSGLKSHLCEILCLSWLSASLKKITWKWRCYRVHNIFSTISLWELLVAMETKLWIQSAPKPYAAFPPPQWSFI